MAQKQHRLTVLVEDYDDTKIEQACLLSLGEAAVAEGVLKRCGMAVQLDEVEGPFFTLKADRGGSTLSTTLRTLDEVTKLLPEFEPRVLDDLKAGKEGLHLNDSRNGVPICVEVFRGPVASELPEIPSVRPGLLPETKGAGLGLAKKER